MNIKERAMDSGRFSEGFRRSEEMMFDRNRTEEKQSVSATD